MFHTITVGNLFSDNSIWLLLDMVVTHYLWVTAGKVHTQCWQTVNYCCLVTIVTMW